MSPFHHDRGYRSTWDSCYPSSKPCSLISIMLDMKCCFVLIWFVCFCEVCIVCTSLIGLCCLLHPQSHICLSSLCFVQSTAFGPCTSPLTSMPYTCSWPAFLKLLQGQPCVLGTGRDQTRVKAVPNLGQGVFVCAFLSGCLLWFSLVCFVVVFVLWFGFFLRIQ